MTHKTPILEFDDDRSAILMPDPYRFAKSGPIPARGVLCFFKDVFDALLAEGKLIKLGDLHSEIGDHPVYSYLSDGKPVTVLHPGVGAPLAAGFLEELIAVGVTKYIVCGGCGVLNQEIAAGHPIILTAAIRDEGTSYHYLPAAREVKANPKGVAALEKAFKESGLEYRTGKTWTTDAIYREPRASATPAWPTAVMWSRWKRLPFLQWRNSVRSRLDRWYMEVTWSSPKAGTAGNGINAAMTAA
jgi:uridine phosphorylase